MPAKLYPYILDICTASAICFERRPTERIIQHEQVSTSLCKCYTFLHREAGMFGVHMGDEVKERMLPNRAPTFGDPIYVGHMYAPDTEVKEPRLLILLDQDCV